MSNPSGDPITARNRSRWFVPFCLLGLAVITTSCKPEAKQPPKPVAEVAVQNELTAQLAGARIDQARIKLEQKRPGESLALLVSALKADPASSEARMMVENLLKETVWNFPTLTIPHQQPIDQIQFAAPSSLWVSLGGKINTTVHWNLETCQIESLLFPIAGTVTRSLTFDPLARFVVIERGTTTLLCDALSLKPIRDLGPLPDFVTPAATVVFSADGLLMAHPGFASKTDRSVVWHLRDTRTGEILRTSEIASPDSPRPLAASLDRDKLRILHANGRLLEMPVSPVEPEKSIPMPEPVKLISAQFSRDGNAVLTLQEQGPHQPPVQSIISYQDIEDGSLELNALVNRFPWSRHPNFWNSLMVTPETAPFAVSGNSLQILIAPHAPVETAGAITAATFRGEKMITGEESGMITFHQFLPLPELKHDALAPSPLGDAQLIALEKLCQSLSGIHYDDKERTFIPISPPELLKAAGDCDMAAFHAAFPTLNFANAMTRLKELQPQTIEADAFQPLRDRVARANLSGNPPPPSPAMEEAFGKQDGPAILIEIRETGGKGASAAHALALALKSEHPEWISACLDQAVDLPPFVRTIATSRIDWLAGHRSKALSPWPESFPELTEIRQREDWDGWEQADFGPALEMIRQCVIEELVAIEVPKNSTPEQRKAVADRLADPETVATVGKARFAIACMKAAIAFSEHKEDSETTFNLANTARNLGAPAEPCMRAEALALTAMGDYEKAHPIWIELITEHPLETQIPGDYAEAAYTAFENADPQQAMTILTTGMHRYPQDGNFALRAGWVALLTGNSDRGYQFLQAGKRTGFPEEKVENATALLTIAAAQSGFYDDATVYFNDLLRIDPAWAKVETLDTLDWPEELKSTLSQFMQ